MFELGLLESSTRPLKFSFTGEDARVEGHQRGPFDLFILSNN